MIAMQSMKPIAYAQKILLQSARLEISRCGRGQEVLRKNGSEPVRKLRTGGERGIRTLEGLLALTPLAGARLRPLGHLSATHRGAPMILVGRQTGQSTRVTRALRPAYLLGRLLRRRLRI